MNQLPTWVLSVLPLLYCLYIVGLGSIVNREDFKDARLFNGFVVFMGFLYSIYYIYFVGFHDIYYNGHDWAVWLKAWYISLSVLCFVMFLGGAIMTSGELAYKDGKVRLRKNGPTNFLFDKLNYDPEGQSLCRMSWMCLFCIIGGALLIAIGALAFVIIPLINILWYGRIVIITDLNDFPKDTFDQNTFGNSNAPVNLLAILSTIIGFVLFHSSGCVGWLVLGIVGIILFLVHWFALSYMQDRGNHPIVSAVGHAIEHTVDTVGEFKGKFCPTITISD